MSVLSDEQLMDIARPACGNFRWPSTALDIMRAAIAADRAARAEPDGCVQWCPPNEVVQKAYADGWNACVRIMRDTAPPAAPVVQEGWRAMVERLVSATDAAAYGAAIHEARAMLAAAPAPSRDNGGAA